MVCGRRRYFESQQFIVLLSFLFSKFELNEGSMFGFYNPFTYILLCYAHMMDVRLSILSTVSSNFVFFANRQEIQ